MLPGLFPYLENMMRYKAAIFDFDGTILNTLADLADSMNNVLTSLKMPTHQQESYRYFVGDGMLNLARRAAPAGTDEATLHGMVEAMNAVYAANWSVQTRPYDGVADMLAAFRARGFKLAVLSNKPDVFTKEMASHYFGGDLFDITLGAREGVPRKPDPTAALEIARLFKIAPADILYFGDTNTDMRTGRSAGMFTIGVGWGFRPVSELVEAGAQCVIDRPGQALDIIES